MAIVLTANDLSALKAGTYKVGEHIKLHLSLEHDPCMGAPWKEYDGHGVVTGWVQRGKKAGERLLSSDCGSSRYYNMAATQKIAIRDGWGPQIPGKSKKQAAAEAVERDFERLRAWCNDEWHWSTVVLAVIVAGSEVASATVGGVESDADDVYLLTLVNDIVLEALDAAKDKGREIAAAFGE